MLYAQIPARRNRQILGDLATLGWALGWSVVAWSLHGQLLRLAAPGRALQSAGADLADSLTSVGKRVGALPLAGSELRKPFEAAAGAGRTLADAGVAQQHGVSQLALLIPLLLAGPPVLFVLLRWATGRLSWIRRANAAARAGSIELDLYALRALTRQPMSRLRRLSSDPAGDWRRGDPAMLRALADLELAELGLRAESLP